jgi:hypothetical protein
MSLLMLEHTSMAQAMWHVDTNGGIQGSPLGYRELGGTMFAIEIP